MCLGQIRALDRPPETLLGAVRLAVASQGAAQIVPGVSIVRIEVERRLKWIAAATSAFGRAARVPDDIRAGPRCASDCVGSSEFLCMPHPIRDWPTQKYYLRSDLDADHANQIDFRQPTERSMQRAATSGENRSSSRRWCTRRPCAHILTPAGTLQWVPIAEVRNLWSAAPRTARAALDSCRVWPQCVYPDPKASWRNSKTA